MPGLGHSWPGRRPASEVRRFSSPSPVSGRPRRRFSAASFGLVRGVAVAHAPAAVALCRRGRPRRRLLAGRERRASPTPGQPVRGAGERGVRDLSRRAPCRPSRLDALTMPPRSEQLSPRQREVLGLLADGRPRTRHRHQARTLRGDGAQPHPRFALRDSTVTPSSRQSRAPGSSTCSSGSLGPAAGLEDHQRKDRHEQGGGEVVQRGDTHQPEQGRDRVRLRSPRAASNATPTTVTPETSTRAPSTWKNNAQS